MPIQLQKSLTFLASHLPLNCISVGVTQLPSLNIFQSFSDYFSGKSGPKRISYVAVSDDSVKIIHFKGLEVLQEINFSIHHLQSIEISEGKTDDGIVAIINLTIEHIVKIDKNGNKKTKSIFLKIMPPLLGQNASPIQAVDEILWAQNNRKNIVPTLNAWLPIIAARLAEEERILEEKRLEKERILEEKRLEQERILEEKRLAKEEKN